MNNPVQIRDSVPVLAPEMKLDQKQDTDLLTLAHPAYRARYMYRRSNDSRRRESGGQDYIAFRHSNSRFAFCLCDGVSQSFMGNLAAQFLGDRVVRWLWTEAGALASEPQFASAMATFLDGLKNGATRMVDAYRISSGVANLTVSVLEELRPGGSASTFAAGYLVPPCPEHPDGVVALVWLGDSRITGWKNDGTAWERVAPDTFKSDEQWSSRNGMGGHSPHCVLDNWSGLDRIVVYSDGLLPVHERLADRPADPELKTMIIETSERRNSDDIAFLEITLCAPGESPLKLETPRVLATELASGEIGLEWEAVPGAEFYEIELWANEYPEPEPLLTAGARTRWSRPLPIGWERCRVRVRGRSVDRVSEWSNPHLFRAGPGSLLRKFQSLMRPKQPKRKDSSSTRKGYQDEI